MIQYDETTICNIPYLKWIEANPIEFDLNMQKRQAIISASEIITLYLEWKRQKQELDQLNHNLNENSKLKVNIEQCAALKVQINDAKNKELEHRRRLVKVSNMVANLLHPNVPLGDSSKDNVILEESGQKITNSMHHEDIAIEMGCWQRSKATELSGSRFVILEGKLAAIERALFQFAVHYLISQGFTELSVPYIVNKKAAFNSGQLPKFEDDYFKVGEQCLIFTGEVPLVNYFANTILKEGPKKVFTFTQCFRKEAGSLGRDTKGMIRLHQFGKVEMVCVTKPNDSDAMHKEMLNHSKQLLNLLKVPYRVVDVCSGDIGFTAARQFDIEAWMPGQGKYVEVASCSNCWDFQAQRAGIKYIVDNNKINAHTLNATAISGRVVAAILENFYLDNNLIIPEVLKPYI